MMQLMCDPIPFKMAVEKFKIKKGDGVFIPEGDYIEFRPRIMLSVEQVKKLREVVAEDDYQRNLNCWFDMQEDPEFAGLDSKPAKDIACDQDIRNFICSLATDAILDKLWEET